MSERRFFQINRASFWRGEPHSPEDDDAKLGDAIRRDESRARSVIFGGDGDSPATLNRRRPDPRVIAGSPGQHEARLFQAVVGDFVQAKAIIMHGGLGTTALTPDSSGNKG